MRLVYIEKIPDKDSVLDYNEAHHLVNVLRMKSGDKFALIDGKGSIAIAKIKGISTIKRNLKLLYRVEKITVHQRVFPQITLYIAPPKGKKFDTILQQITELGVCCVQPIITKYSVSCTSISNRHKEITISAMKQSTNPFMPLLKKALKFEDALRECKTLGFFGSPLTEKKHEDFNFNTAKMDYISLWVGPEGGFSNTEESMFLERDILPLTLGNYILRVETAVVALISRLIPASIGTNTI